MDPYKMEFFIVAIFLSRADLINERDVVKSLWKIYIFQNLESISGPRSSTYYLPTLFIIFPVGI